MESSLQNVLQDDARLTFPFLRNGGRHCLVCEWVDTVVSHFLQYFDLPMVTIGQERLTQEYMAREQRDNCFAASSVRPSGFLALLFVLLFFSSISSLLFSSVADFPLRSSNSHYSFRFLQPWL